MIDGDDGFDIVIVSAASYDDLRNCIPTALSPDTEYALVKDMQVAFVNPHSANKKIAEMLLEYYVDYTDMQNQIVMCPKCLSRFNLLMTPITNSP